jgi:negative regulator of flagellin synthesis FlgM
MVVTTVLLATAARHGRLWATPAPALSGFGPPLLSVTTPDGRATASWYTGFGWLLEPADVQKHGTMRIEPSPIQPSQSSAERQAAEPSEPRLAAPATEGVELSDGAEHLPRTRAEAAAAPDVRAERVAALKEQIQSGTYQIDDVALAEKLLDIL